ncbi:MAG: CRTAC1 family protein [Myxococcales bacterium]|nr:CRTAC1 family protein [Myxococcales bacterium]
MRTGPLLAIGPLLLLPLSACSGGVSPITDGGPPDAARPPLSCREPGALQPGPWFTDITAEVFPGAPVVGNRFTLADLDGDSLPDLITHHGSGTRPVLEGVNALTTWRVLMNRARPGGGRQFDDATVTSGYGAARDGSPNRAASLAAAGDFDNDGDLDLFSGYYADVPDLGDRNELLLNDGAGGFVRALGGALEDQTSLPWHVSGAAPLDFDRDGLLDLYVGYWYEVYGFRRGQQDRLYRGRGDGTFEDVTLAVGLETSDAGYADGSNHRPTYGVAACDVDDDGAPDLLAAAYGRQWNLLYHNDGGAFTEVGRPSGYAGDALEDFSDNEFYRCYCAATPGACTPAPPAPRIMCQPNSWQAGTDDQPWRLGGNTFTTACGDADGDGDLDLYNAEIKHWHIGESSDGSQLLIADRDGSTGAGVAYRRPGVAATGLAIPHPVSSWNEGGLMAAFWDYDLDGALDLFVAASDYEGNRGLLYRGDGDGTFTEVAQEAGVAHICASGIAVGDLDGDGDEDLIVGSSTARDCSATWSSNEVHVYRNELGQQRNSLRLRLVGAASGNGAAGANRAAIGARIRVTTGGRTLRRDVTGAYGHFAIGNDLVVLVGLDSACEADVEVRWPDAAGTVETFAGVRANYAVELSQGGETRYLP